MVIDNNPGGRAFPVVGKCEGLSGKRAKKSNAPGLGPGGPPQRLPGGRGPFLKGAHRDAPALRSPPGLQLTGRGGGQRPWCWLKFFRPRQESSDHSSFFKKGRPKLFAGRANGGGRGTRSNGLLPHPSSIPCFAQDLMCSWPPVLPKTLLRNNDISFPPGKLNKTGCRRVRPDFAGDSLAGLSAGEPFWAGKQREKQQKSSKKVGTSRKRGAWRRNLWRSAFFAGMPFPGPWAPLPCNRGRCPASLLPLEAVWPHQSATAGMALRACHPTGARVVA